MRQIEQWRDIEGYEGLYLVSSLGRIKSLDRWVNNGKGKRLQKGEIITPFKNKKGYLRVALSNGFKRIKYSIHRLVAMAFLPNPDNLETVNHINGIVTDNRVENLEWMSNRDNVRYSQAKAVKQYSLDGEFIRKWDAMADIERELGFNHGDVCLCCKGKARTAYGFIWRYA